MRRFTVTYEQRSLRTMEMETHTIEGCVFSDGRVAYVELGVSHGSLGGTVDELLNRNYHGGWYLYGEPTMTWVDPE